MATLPTPEPGRASAESFVATHLADLFDGPVVGSSRFSGGQVAADAALTAFDVAGYASRRNDVLPRSARGASALSPYIRHGLLRLSDVWHHVGAGPSRDVSKFRDELLWQEYARHWYLHLGHRSASGVRREQATIATDASWDRTMACVDATLTELEQDGWLVNQTRMWLSSDWAVRRNGAWLDGEDHFFRHLLDGSRAANRMGWQWTVGTGSAKHYGFSRSQVERRAPELCHDCPHQRRCPISDWPTEPGWRPVSTAERRSVDPGPLDPDVAGSPDVVWLTGESLGHDDPALLAHPGLPVLFVFDEPLLARLRLSAKRLVFLTETLAELGTTRTVHLRRGDPSAILTDHRPAVTFAPVPGFARISRRITLAAVHPYPWLVRPDDRPIGSFSAWRRTTARRRVT